MKLGIMADAFRDRSWADACRTTKELELEAIEPVTGGHGGSAHCSAVEMIKDENEVNKFKKTADVHGLLISGFSCHCNPLHPNKKIAEKYIADVEASMKLASKIGVKVIILFAGLPGAGDGALYPNWITHPYPLELADAYEWQWNKVIIPFWSEMVKKAKKSGVKFAFEMEPGNSVYNPETVLKLRDAVGEEEIACNFDPGHLFYQGMNLEAAVRKLGDAIVYVHIKDAKIEQSVVDATGILDAKHFRELSTRAWNYATVGYGHGKGFWKKLIATLRLVFIQA